MLKTLIAVVTLITVVWATLRTLGRVGQDSGHQFPTAYQLLKDSPLIQHREQIALRFIWALMLLFLVLLFTQVL